MDDQPAQGVLASRDRTRPLGALNLLKFRPAAVYEPGSGDVPCSGAEAYSRYASRVSPLLEELGARVILTGKLWLIERPGEWDAAFVVYYPSGDAFVSLTRDPAYRRIAHHRTAALADSRLLVLDFDDRWLDDLGQPTGLT